MKWQWVLTQQKTQSVTTANILIWHLAWKGTKYDYLYLRNTNLSGTKSVFK